MKIKARNYLFIRLTIVQEIKNNVELYVKSKILPCTFSMITMFSKQTTRVERESPMMKTTVMMMTTNPPPRH